MARKNGARKDTIYIPGKGTTTVTAGGVGLGQKASFDLTHLASADPSGGVGGNFGFTHELIARFDGNLKNTNVAARTVKAKKLPSALLQTVRLNANGHLFWDLQDMGGDGLRHIEEIETGRAMPFSADYVVPGSGTNGGILAFTYSFSLKAWDSRFMKPTDRLIPIKLLQKAILELTPQAAGWLGADVSLDSFTITVAAKVSELDHYRQPALWSWVEKRQSSNDDFLQPAGVMYQDAHLVRLQAAGLTYATFDTDQTDVNGLMLKVDSDLYLETIDTKDVIRNYNSECPLESAAYIPDPTVGTDRIPVFWQGRHVGKITKGFYADNAPRLKFSGDADPAADYRVLEHIQLEQTTEDFARHAVRAGVKIPAGSQVRSKTEDAVPVQKGSEHHSSFLPAELVPPANAAA